VSGKDNHRVFSTYFVGEFKNVEVQAARGLEVVFILTHVQTFEYVEVVA
jgi:hypothetical protein